MTQDADARELLSRSDALLADAAARARATTARVASVDEALDAARAVRRRPGRPLDPPPSPARSDAPSSSTPPDRA